MKLDPYPTSYTEINSKWIKDQSVRPKTIRLLEEHTGQKLHDTGFGNNLLDMTPKAQATKGKVDKLDFIKIKRMCLSNDNINRIKRQSTKWDNICK